MKLIPGSFTKRALIAGVIAGSGILAASSFAMSSGGSSSEKGCAARHEQKQGAMGEGRHAEHLSELKAKLKLKPEQEAAWNTFAASTEPGMRAVKADRQAMRGEFEKLSTPQRLDKMLEMSDLRRTKMLERAEAIKVFYAQLTPEQQAVFDAEAKPERHRNHGQRDHDQRDHARHRIQS